MELSGLDIGILAVFFVCVITVGLFKSRKEKTSEEYFLAGRGLKWWLIGFSLIAANISAEQFVGMSGQAAKGSIGLAVASYEWIAAITLVGVAFFFLPKFLKSGIFTIPEYLEYRFNHTSRLVMSLLMVIIYLGVTIPTVIFLGAKALSPLFKEQLMGVPINITTLSWFVGILAGVYVAAGGLKACAWADLIQGSALILGGAVIMVLAFMALDNPSGFEGIDAAAVNTSLGVGDGATFGQKFAVLKAANMHMVLPRTSDFLPWTALLLGIWIPNLYYWGLNQYIMQRTLGAHSLREGQRGVVFAAFLKLIIPFVVCIPGIIAFTLYGAKMQENAMNQESLNKPVLEAFEKAKASPAEAKMVIPFNSDFAHLQPQLAAEVLSFNAAVLSKVAPAGEDLSAINEELLEGVEDSHPDIQVRQELVGYDYDGAFPLLIRYLECGAESAGVGRSLLRTGRRSHRVSDRAGAGESEVQRRIRVYPGIPGLRLTRRADDLPVRIVREEVAAELRGAGLNSEPDYLRDSVLRLGRHGVPEPHGDYGRRYCIRPAISDIDLPDEGTSRTAGADQDRTELV